MPPEISSPPPNIFLRSYQRSLLFLRSHKIISAVSTAVILLLGFGIFSLVRPAAPEYVTQVVERSDLKQTVEAVGTVISEKDLALQFATSGIVAQVLVKEGDHVKAGQRLALLRAGNLGSQVQAASARLQVAEANLAQLLEGARIEDIAVKEAEVLNKRAALEAERAKLAAAEQKLVTLRGEADTSLAGDITSADSTIAQQLSTAEIALGKIDDVLKNVNIQDSISRMGSPPDISNQIVKGLIHAARNTPVIDKASALSGLQKARAALSAGTAFGNRIFVIVSTLTTTNALTTSERETHKATIATEQGNMQSALSALDTATQNLQDAAAVFDTRIATEEATITSAQGNILTFESALRIEEAALALKKAPPRATDIAAEQARVREARAEVGRVQASFADTIITAPTEGTITAVHVKPGEQSPSGPAITLLGMSPYRVEMFVSEIDVPKVQLQQTGSIVLDAFPGKEYVLRVGEIDPAATDKDGVSKYRIKLDFLEEVAELKIGMTGDAEIFTGEREDVLSVPRRAILERPNGTEYVRILQDGDVVERDVATGMEGGTGDIEIVSGIDEGDVVIVLEKE